MQVLTELCNVQWIFIYNKAILDFTKPKENPNVSQ